MIQEMQAETMNRRRFLDLALGALTGLGALAMSAVVFVYLWPGQKGSAGIKRQKVCAVDDMPEGGAKKVMYKAIPVIVIRLNGKYTAFNAKCTHLQCVVDWELNRGLFVCPCHGATFDINGVPQVSITSVPLAPMKAYAAGGFVYVEGV